MFSRINYSLWSKMACQKSIGSWNYRDVIFFPSHLLRKFSYWISEKQKTKIK